MSVSDEELARRFILFMAGTRQWFKQQLGDFPHEGNMYSEARFRILHVISEKERLKMSDLSRMCHITKGSLTTTLGKLVEEGYVERVFDHGDRRVVMVKLTDAGKLHLEKVKQAVITRMSKAFGSMSEKNRIKLAALLTELTDIFK